MSFLDINKALQDGHFGDTPKGWGDTEWNLLISYVSQGMDYDDKDWDSLDHTPQIWTTIEEARERAPPASRKHIEDPRKMSKEADPYMKHMMEMPAFKACDALSTSTNSARQGDDADSDGSFQETEGSIWYNALKKWIPNTLEILGRGKG